MPGGILRATAKLAAFPKCSRLSHDGFIEAPKERDGEQHEERSHSLDFERKLQIGVISRLQMMSLLGRYPEQALLVQGPACDERHEQICSVKHRTVNAGLPICWKPGSSTVPKKSLKQGGEVWVPCNHAPDPERVFQGPSAVSPANGSCPQMTQS